MRAWLSQAVLIAFAASAVAQDVAVAVSSIDDVSLVLRPYCATSCGKLVKEGWEGYIDSSMCHYCTCQSGAFTNCRVESKECALNNADTPVCLEEDDKCADLKELCPVGTTCAEGADGVARCAQTSSSACAKTTCDSDAVCKISAFGTAICRKGCTKTCGEYVPHGWSGKDNGGNWCNTCWCQNGVMVCTKMGCLARRCPRKCTPYTVEEPCLLTPISPIELTLEAAKPAVSALTFRRLCYNAATCTCGFYPHVLCLINPCSLVSCNEGYHCEANYCGGCNYQCVKDKCPPRVRKAWSTLPCAERKLFVRAVKAYKLAHPSEYSDFVSMHQQAWSYAHSSSQFFPWHRWYLVGFENALRAMGGEFECVTIPYWDWEKDAGSEATSSPLRCDTFGRSSGIDSSNCVNEGIAAYPAWTISDGTSCLRRTFNPAVGFSGEATLLAHITTRPAYSSFRPALEGSPHASPHVYVGGHMGMMTSPEDPLFWIHHCNVDRLWALWQDYYGYDEIAKGSYTNTEYYPAANLNNVMPFDIDSSGTVLSYFSSPVTVRDMMHIHDMPYGNSYKYGTDALAFTLSTPVSGSWSWVTPASMPKVACLALCNIKFIDTILVDRIWFHNAVIPFEATFKQATCEMDTIEPKVRTELFQKLAHVECDALAKKQTATDEWVKTMWREDASFFERCVGL